MSRGLWKGRTRCQIPVSCTATTLRSSALAASQKKYPHVWTARLQPDQIGESISPLVRRRLTTAMTLSIFRMVRMNLLEPTKDESTSWSKYSSIWRTVGRKLEFLV
ncbi:unnamed protein product [Amoebophrya sp. A25]|nr:unnamed protein product [Amoebophrya sp. A25]|eukprot:GSA25T00021158001.1